MLSSTGSCLMRFFNPEEGDSCVHLKHNTRVHCCAKSQPVAPNETCVLPRKLLPAQGDSSTNCVANKKDFLCS